MNMAVTSNLITKVKGCIEYAADWRGTPVFEYKYPWTGITVQDITPEEIFEAKNTITRGTQVKSVIGPASVAGVEPGDIITMIDNQEVNNSDEFYSFIAEYDVGDSIDMHIVRGAEEIDTTLVLGEKP